MGICSTRRVERPALPLGLGNATGKPGQNQYLERGHFPYQNTQADGFYGTAPAKSFPANAYKLYDMAGNVWEWTADWYDNSYYSQVKPGTRNPEGSNTPNDPSDDPANRKARDTRRLFYVQR